MSADFLPYVHTRSTPVQSLLAMTASTLSHPAVPVHRRGAFLLLPGILLSAIVAVIALVIAAAEEHAFGHPVVDGLVIAILIGMLVRTLWAPAAAVEPGVRFVAREVLEVAVLLLGASVDLALLVRAGPSLAIGVVLLVCLSIACSYGIGRALGLPHPLALLVACGNSICGNSAIAAVAPAIRAGKEHVASAIAFTAILGVAVVVGLPFLLRPLGLSFYQYGVLTGLTVYAVPQVLAAAFPVSLLSGQVGTLVKMVRVLMLGPIVVVLALVHRNDTDMPKTGRPRLQLTQVVPWFIIGFLVLAGLRSSGTISGAVGVSMKALSTWLTVAAMAALGLGVDLRSVRTVGRPMVLTVTASLVVLIALSVALIHLLAIR